MQETHPASGYPKAVSHAHKTDATRRQPHPASGFWLLHQADPNPRPNRTIDNRVTPATQRTSAATRNPCSNSTGARSPRMHFDCRASGNQSNLDMCRPIRSLWLPRNQPVLES
jgi:hypothetical protein